MNPIRIKPSHAGLFTAKAKKAGMGVQQFAAHVLANKTKHDPATIKQANFARNAAGFKKAAPSLSSLLGNQND